MRPTNIRALRCSALLAALPVAATIFSPLAPEAFAIPPRGERVANRIAERRYARASITDARAARAEARVAEIAPAVPVPPPPRPATVRRMARAGVPLGGPPPVAAGSPPRSAVVAAPPAPPRAAAGAPQPAPANAPGSAATVAEPGVWTLDPDPVGGPAVAADGTRSVLATGGAAPVTPPGPAAAAGRPGAAVTQPPVELLPVPATK